MKLEEVEALKELLDNKKKTMSKEVLREICEEFDKKFIYESTTFDNDDFTYEDVCFLLEDHSREFPDKKQNRRQEIINNYHAINRVHRLVDKRVELDETIVKDLHQMLVDGIITGGVYRTRDLFILGAKHVPPTYLKIFKKMDQYFSDLKNPELKGLEKAAFAHLQLLKIYPFMDANGRLARLLLNYQLELEGYLPISITKNQRDDYFKNIDEYKINKKIEPFTEFLADLEAKRIKEFIERD
ncbi:MAG: Fic family protein [Candidatus Izemoplasmatales bacterium]|jgi:Fic family protein|nr:Fic family protein [Candidatus Izemoplasmatales bacterium]MDY0138687.1 Fic family protein [Candidatus Izemoplasmatales bacterium]